MTTRTRVTAALGILAVAAATSSAPAVAAPRPHPTPVGSDRYIVRTASGSQTGAVASSARQQGGRVTHVYSGVLHGFSATLTDQQARQVRARPGVKSVTRDLVVHATDVQLDPTWGLDRIDQRGNSLNHVYRYGSTGAGVTAFVVDSGVRTSHHQFGHRAVSGYDFVGHDRHASDCSGHGTHVAGTIGGRTYGVAKGVRLVAVRTLDCDGGGWASDLIHGLDWVVAHKPKGPSVVNLSVSGPAYPLIDRAVERVVAAGIPVVVAAGNDGVSACTESPARAPHVLTVGAVDSHGRRPRWSDAGHCVDVFAPGVGIRSASYRSNTGSAVMSGTSMAAPHVTGVVARYLQSHPRATPAQTAAAVVRGATSGRVGNRSGAPDRLLYTAGPVTAPAAPAGLSATLNRRTRSLAMRWRVPRDTGGRAISGYRVTSRGTVGRPVTVALSGRTRSHTFTKLSPGATYRLTVRAVNARGVGRAASRTIRTPQG